MRDLLILVEAADADFEEARSEIGYALSEIIKMGRVLGGEPSIDDLDAINQGGLASLQLEVEKIENRIESVWQKSVQDDLGGQAALGEIGRALGREGGCLYV